MEGMAFLQSVDNWVFFHIVIGVILFVDLIVLGKRELSLRSASVLALIWVVSALVFGWVIILPSHGMEGLLEYVTAYIIEYSLSVDNLFVFAVIFGYFGIQSTKNQHRILFWGILGAIVMRATFLFAGIQLIEAFEPIIYLFGLILIYSGIKLLKSDEEKEMDPSKNLVVRYASKIFEVDTEDKKHFFIRNKKKLAITPLFLTLLAVETTDVIFAVDSVPAVLSITQTFFIAYTANVFAVAGLRSLYFVVIGALERLKYLHIGLAVILIFLGGKFLAEEFIHISPLQSLIVVTLILTIVTIASYLKKEKTKG